MQTRPIRTHVNTSNRTDAQEIRFLDPSALRAPKRNVRVHSKKQIDQIANSILRFGWTYPILIDEHGNVICGNGRLFASQKLGLREVPTITMSGLSETEMRALALADNKIAANSEWDRKELAIELGELATLLPEINFSVEDMGFDAAEFDGLWPTLETWRTRRKPWKWNPCLLAAPATYGALARTLSFAGI